MEQNMRDVKYEKAENLSPTFLKTLRSYRRVVAASSFSRGSIPREKVGDLSNIPQCNGVYFLCDRHKKPLYIGKAISLRARLKSHFKNPSWLLRKEIGNIKKIGFINTQSEIESLILESMMIKKYRPELNIMQKDDKQFFYVGVTNEIYPKVFITHQLKTKIRNPKHEIQNKYVGPFTDGKSLKITLRLLRRIFPYYTKKHGKLSCFYCHLDLCPGVNPEPKEYRKNTRKLLETLQGKNMMVLRELKKEMIRCAKSHDFEKAAKIRDQIRNLENVFAHGYLNKFKMQNAKCKIIADETIQISKSKLVFGKLKKYLGLKITPCHIEAYDISNIQGVFAVGSMVTFINGFPEKKDYRRFKIKTLREPNDVAMLEEMLQRRINHPEWPYPDLILIDGGIAQLNAAKSAIKQFGNLTIPVIALAKRENLLYVEGRNVPIPLKNLPREISNLVLRLRDEAHRFAINYYRKRHGKFLISP